MNRLDTAHQWAGRFAPTVAELRSLALSSYAELPQSFRDLVGKIDIRVVDHPSDELMEDLSLETPFDLLGLFEGQGAANRWNPAQGRGPNKVTLFRRAMLDYWAENDETLGEIVCHILIHEVGHHFGLEDEELERLEAGADSPAIPRGRN